MKNHIADFDDSKINSYVPKLKEKNSEAYNNVPFQTKYITTDPCYPISIFCILSFWLKDLR